MFWNEKRRPKEWAEAFSSEERPVTIFGYIAGAVCRTLFNAIEAQQAARHSEAMLGRLETYLSRRDRLYGLSEADAQALLAREDQERERLAIQEAGRLGAGGEHA